MPFKKILKAAYEYEATAEDELNFNEGDILGIIGDEEGEDGWYYGCNVLVEPETNGFIPTTYCEELKVIEEVKAGYEYSAQEENELSFGEGQVLQVLHRIDDDWWLAKDETSGECGMVPANYFGQTADQDEYEAEAYEEPAGYEPKYEEQEQEEQEEQEEEVKYYAPPPPPPPMPSFDEPEEQEEKQEEQEAEQEYQVKENPVDNLSNSQFLKQKCDALFLDSKFAKTKGQLIFEKALYLCTSNSIEHCYDLSELRDYDAYELKLTLNSGDKVAIGLGKKDAKKFAELVKEISGYEEAKEKEQQKEEAPPLPKAPVVVGPKIPENYLRDNKKSETTKTPVIVGVSFEGLEGEEVSIFEGEEVYLLSSDGDNSIADSQFARIEKVNGVQGIVPKNFLMSRSEYQKKKEKDAEIEEEIKKQMTELSMASEAKNVKSKPSTYNAPAPASTTDTVKAADSSVARTDSKKSSSPWSALASGSTTVALPKPQQKQSNNVKLENSRLWKDKSGKFQVEAEFVSLIDGKVTILKTSGSEVTVPLEILSERDIEYSCKRAGIPYTKKAPATNRTNGGTKVKGFDWLAFFLSIGIESDKAREFGEKFASQSFEESMISTFTSDFLTAQGMQMTEIYKILPEAAKRKAQAMQANAKEKHRSNNSQVVLSSGAPPEVKKKPTATASASTLVPFKSEEKDLVIHEDSPKIQMFPTIEELESQGAIELGKGNSQVALPGGISVSKSSNDDTSRVIVQPIESADVKERRREVVGADGSTAKEYTRISTSTSVAPVDSMGSSAIALMQQQMQTNAMMQAQAQAQVQMQMRMQAQAQAQMQMQMRAQAAAQAQAQAQAQFQQQQRMYQMQQKQQQQSAPSVHITIHTGDKGVNQNPMTPPMPLMNQPMMQMNNAGMMGGMMAPIPMNPMAGAIMAPNLMNPMAAMNPMNPMSSMNPFDPTNPYNNNGFGF